MPSNNLFGRRKRRAICVTAVCLLLSFGLLAQEPSEPSPLFTDEQMIEAQNAAERANRGADVEKTVVVPPQHVVALTWRRGLRERIVDLEYVHGKFVIAWVSPLLDEHFEVTTKDDFQLLHTPEFDGVTFHGCEAHMCDSTRGIYLYVPKARQGFEAKIDNAKDVTYSPNLQQPANKRYRQWMEKTVKDLSLPWR